MNTKEQINNRKQIKDGHILYFLDTLTYYNNVSMTTVNDKRIKVANERIEVALNDLTEYYLNNY